MKAGDAHIGDMDAKISKALAKRVVGEGQWVSDGGHSTVIGEVIVSKTSVR